ncbi:hypothetical protein N7456_009758 [Penicillium angulare]|uniref:Uncharacterized protein n=1 Tax=Penicillium angulare TaxID=116970 RepID=A0A9W9F5G5_9EURO|nr:hypothetical protein N7456_009758 [Penicillium angulare]
MSESYSDYVTEDIPRGLADPFLGDLPGELPENVSGDTLTGSISPDATRLNEFPQQCVSHIGEQNMNTCATPMPVPVDPEIRPVAESHRSAAKIDAATPASPVPTKRAKRVSAPFKEPKNLPQESGLLDQDDILKLISYTPNIRKKYSPYFTTSGHIRAEWYPLLFERDANGGLTLPESIIASNVPNWSNKLRTYESTKRAPSASKSTSPAANQQQPLKRPASQTVKRPSKRVAKTPDPGGEEGPVARMEDLGKLSAMPTAASPSDNMVRPNEVPASAPSKEQLFADRATHGHPQIPQQIPSLSYNPMQSGFAPSQTHSAACLNTPRLENFTSSPNLAFDTVPNLAQGLYQIEFLQKDWVEGFIRWINSRVQQLHMVLAEASEAGRSHEYQTHLTHLINALYQLRMALLRLDSFLRAEAIMQ